MLGFVALAGCSARAQDLGKVNEKNPPTKEELKEPANASKVAAVGLRATVKGQATVAKGQTVYVLVNPLSNKDTKDVWWVAEEVSSDADGKFRCIAQFGEGDAGKGEFFAAIGILSDEKLTVGQMFNGLPKAAAYSKLLIVKRD